MAQFAYQATTKQGQLISGTHEAETQDEVATFLHDQGLVVISIEEDLGFNWNKLKSIQIGGVPLNDRVIFAKQLSTMISAGLPIIQALDILVQQTENASLKEKLQRVYNSVEAGSSLAEAFSKDKTIFNDLQISLIIAGETSGTLNEVMLQIADDMEKSKQLRGKIIGAMIYPALLFGVMAVVLVVMLVFMIPSVKDLYTNFGATELPFATQLLVDLSGTITKPLVAIVLVLTIVFWVVGIRYYYSTPSGRRVLDRLLLKVPIFGNLTAKIQLAQFCRLLSLLLKNGVSIVDALKIVANALSNQIYKDIIYQAVGEVTKGNSLSIPLAKDKVFPVLMLKMIATGEETGNLDKVTGDMAEFYESDVNEITGNLTKLMEPFILLVVGGLVGFMAVAIYLPLYSLGQYVK
jgi:type IV pilus assembly protein PilC